MSPDLFPSNHTTGLRDNHSRGSAGDFLRDHIQPGSELSFVSAYFTINAYLNANEQLLKDSPPGLYAVVSTRADLPKCQPGVIFCLRQGDRNDAGRDKSKINPLRSHFLLYILDSGDVRLSFAQPKATLQLFRELAAGKSTAYPKLCDQFDSFTKNGSGMSHYAGLVASALRAIQSSFEKRAAHQLLSGRDGLLPNKSETPDADAGDWELVTWLVILEKKYEG